MPKRSPSSQSAHDSRVRREAMRLKAKGWNVKADVSGYDRPTPIGKDRRVPDIEATKAGHKRLMEVETADTEASDRKQRSTFNRSAAQKPNTTFRTIVEE